MIQMNAVRHHFACAPVRALACATALWLAQYPAMASNVCDTLASLTNPQASSLQAPGTGGTGMLAARPGIGGTGMLAMRPGIGGTGIDKGGMGGTGIVGVITGFASICVGGVEVHYNDQTPMTENGQPSQASGLAVGQVVVVNAAGVGDEVQARQVALLHVAIGPLQSANPQTGEFQLLGQHALAATPAQLAGLQAKQWVRVSGQRNASGDIMASHVEPVAPQQQAQLLGVLSQNGQQFAVAGSPVQMQSAQMAHLAHEKEVMAQGQWAGDHLVVTRLTTEPTRAVLGATERVVMEGYVHRFDGKTLDMDHRQLSLSPQTQISLALAKEGNKAIEPNQRVRITGRIDANQRIHVERIDAAGKGNRGKSQVLTEPAKATETDRQTEKKSGSKEADESGSEKSASSTTTKSDSSSSHEAATGANKSSESSSQTESTNSSIRASRSNSSGESNTSGSSSGSGESSKSGSSSRSSNSGESKGSSSSGSSGKSGRSGGGESKGK